jgi:UDP-GlcNAc:undecaprenyl-phosphate GlcNAc-1-phosphate transferase
MTEWAALPQTVSTAALAFAVTLAATPLAGWLARRFDLLDRPGGYKAHRQATPLLGGLAVAAGFLPVAFGATVLWVPDKIADLLALAAGAAVILVVGVVDDARGLSAGNKLLWQGCAAAGAGVTLGLLGVRVDLFLNWPALPLTALTALWVVAVINAVNMLDNMNGLSAGLGAIGAACLAIFNLRTGEAAVALGAAALAGSCLGFLPWNWPRGRIFLGDTGSMLLGFGLASLAVMGVYTRGAELPVLAVLAPLFILAIPLLDLCLVVAIRLRSSHAPWRPDRRHISHRLVARGMGPVAAVVTVWAAMLGCGLAALLLPTTGAGEAPLLIALVGAMLVAFFAAAGTRGLP